MPSFCTELQVHRDWRTSLPLEGTVQPGSPLPKLAAVYESAQKEGGIKELKTMREKVFVCCQMCQATRPDVPGDSEDAMKITIFFSAV